MALVTPGVAPTLATLPTSKNETGWNKYF